MTQAQILTEFQKLTMPQQLDLLQAALDVLRKNMSPSQPSVMKPSLADAAQQLLADYQTDSELTCFTALDGEPIPAVRSGSGPKSGRLVAAGAASDRDNLT